MKWDSNLNEKDIHFLMQYLENSSEIPCIIMDEALQIIECNHAFLNCAGLQQKPIGHKANLYLKHPEQTTLEETLQQDNTHFQRISLVVESNNKQSKQIRFEHYSRAGRHYLLGEQIMLNNEENILEEFTYLSNQSTNLTRELSKKNRKMEKLLEDLKEKEHKLQIKSNELKAEITEREKIELALEKAKNEAEKANTMKSKFLATMSHEIRNPMSVILGFADLLYDTDLQPEQKEYIAMVKESASLLLGIINDILDLSKIEAGKMIVEQVNFNLPKELSTTIAMFYQQAKEKGLKLECEISPNLPTMVRGDQRKLRQILVNLLSNAIKFTEEGHIKLQAKISKHEQTSVSSDYVTFTVSDTGIGIPEDKQGLLFESFSQGELQINKKYGGTGLGLVITKQMLELMGGTIYFSSAENQGTTFNFTIPFEKAEANLEDKETDYSYENSLTGYSPAESSKEQKTKLSILLVEDKELNRRLTTILLEKRNWLVTSAANGREALSLLNNHDFDVALMDIHMPVMDGLEATRQIRKMEKETSRHLPIIAMTADAMKGDHEKYLAAGMDHYISKPVKADELYSVIEQTIRKTEYGIRAD